jgi:hypothetical protein
MHSRSGVLRPNIERRGADEGEDGNGQKGHEQDTPMLFVEKFAFHKN